MSEEALKRIIASLQGRVDELLQKNRDLMQVLDDFQHENNLLRDRLREGTYVKVPPEAQDTRATVLSPEKEILSLRGVVSILQKRIEKLVVDNHRLTNLLLASQWTPGDSNEKINPLATQELISREFQEINNEIMQKVPGYQPDPKNALEGPTRGVATMEGL